MRRGASGAGPAITIVTVTKNNIAGLRRTMASLAMQDFQDVQHVVVDGASTDGTQRWLQSGRVFDETLVISEPDKGVYDAMNKGASLAEGSLLNFLNAGDEFAHERVLSNAVDLLDNARSEWGFGLARVVDDAGRQVRPVRRIRYSRRRHALGLIAVPHQATFMRTALFRSLGGFDLSYQLAADTDLLLRASGVASPTLWSTIDVLSLSGGISDRRVYAQVLERHRVREHVPGTSLRPSPVDLVWTGMQLLTIGTRKVGKRVLNLATIGGFTRWWVHRGL